jgi:NAD dependent epimerase/dehydratase family
MKLAITGACGLLGRHVVETALAEGHTVVAIDRGPATVPEQRGLSSMTTDTRDYAALAEAVQGSDAIIHLAAHTTPSAAPEPKVHDDNVASTYHVLLAAEQASIESVCLASSVNVIGARFSKHPHFDYFPVDESHPSYADDPYSLSKWICEQQAKSFALRVPDMSIACLRLHSLRNLEEMTARLPIRLDQGASDLWGCTPMRLAVRACLASVETDLGGAEVFNVVARKTYHPETSETLRQRHYPSVPVKGKLHGHAAFFDSSKAARMLFDGTPPE